ncbi:hepatitis A virus cellular receptor 1 isoform X4 [Canis lupus baileyi]|uniref:Hepatitis A virus cellular receptor 1 n=3 Tax=Canis lupus TaxID=9612 RepID=A0A8C0N1N4_CANLF|nr:hepatitis A virus cellular receptor 1 isoform X4 [Canis lupus familiaris]XP_048965161.1 hepatitis A virus cellular receptor 1 isoform X4 [Canis lupus dingo]ADZ24776.1 hepatitis A virus cellular receptor 1e [Canis lupus familiaris]|eukprot:XP_022273057.1 hepatitis A virus cellular receptor 1 isoform X6 [Canis lupus familiaris]
MQLWVAISSLILLLTDAVVSYVQVNGVVGHPATLPCTYSTASGVTTMCWGRGACPISHCLEEIVWTNGSHVTFQKHLRYKLKGKLSEGDVSLTIENAAQTDSGQYCCRVEHRGWFNDMKLTLSLEIKPVATSSSAMQTAEIQPTALQKTSRTQPTNSPLYSCPTDGNGTVTQSSDGLWHNNQTHVSLAQNSWMTTSKGLYIGICITAVVLLTVLVVVITKKYLCIRNKLEQLNMVSLNDSQTGALQSAAEVGVQAEDNIYIIEDNLYVMD